MTVVEITRPCPWLATNDRDHWAVRNARTRAWRRAAAVYAARVEHIRGPVEIHAVIHKPTRRQYDLDGITPTIKACIDGLRDAGVIEADDHHALTRVTITAGEPRRPGFVVLTITPSQEAAS